MDKKCNECEPLYIHQDEMEVSNEVKYLGHILHDNGKPKATILQRKTKGMKFHARY